MRDGASKGAVPVSGSLELLEGMGEPGAGNRRASGWRVALAASLGAGYFLRCGGGDTVATVGGVLDAPLAHECREDGADGRVPGRGALADLALGERLFGVGEHRDDALLGGFAVRRIVVCGVVAQPQRGAVAVIGKFERDIVEAGGGTVLDAHDDLPLSSAQVQVAVTPGMEFGRPAQSLAGTCGGALAGVVHEHDGGVEPSLQLAQESEDGGDLGDGVLIDAVQAHQGVEDKQAWPDALDGVVQALAVAFEVEAQSRHVDDGDVEVTERRGGGAGDVFEPGAHDVSGVLGGEQHDGSWVCGGEVTQARDARGDGHGEVECEEGFAALGFAADDADGFAAPQRVDEPVLVAGAVLELDRGLVWARRSPARPRALGGLAPGVEEELFVEDLTVEFGGAGEQRVGHDGERPGIATGMGAQGVLEPVGHQRGVAGAERGGGRGAVRGRRARRGA